MNFEKPLGNDLTKPTKSLSLPLLSVLSVLHPGIRKNRIVCRISKRGARYGR